MVAYIKAEGEEYIVPDEHLHLGLFARVDGHHVAVHHRHGAARGRRYEVAVDLCMKIVIFLLKFSLI